jgi:signal transduction histidine kinase
MSLKARYDEAAPKARPPQILVVDDEPANVRLVQAYLSAEGYVTSGAESGAAALKRMEDGEIDLVILDIRMPQMDGFEVCRTIRKSPAHARIPVMFLTAEFHDMDSELAGLEMGADEYLHKPVSRRELVARVKNLLRLANAERDRRLMAQVAQSEKLAAIGQIAAGVAHEINNPLAFILSNLTSFTGYVEDVKRVVEAYRRGTEFGRAVENQLQFEEGLKDLEALIREIAQGGKRVKGIVEELKTFSRSDDDEELEPLDLSEIAESTLLLTEGELSTHARVTKELGSAPIASAPRNRLHQVMLNLLVNAMQAIEGVEGEHEIGIVTRSEGQWAVLEVSDTGCGIPLDFQQRIFDPFFTTKAVGVGTGMGLSVCATTIHKLGGRIEVKSAPGNGTTFTIRLPLDRVAKNRPPVQLECVS